MATQGDFFGCTSHSGQGGAIRSIGPLHIAAFVVVNAGGAVVDRAGNVVKCHRNPLWSNESSVARLLARVGTGTLLTQPGAAGPAGQRVAPVGTTEPTHNTTLSLIVTNRRLNSFELQRLAIQVHTSMARAIQPFSTEDDGDTLFAVSTQELPAREGDLSEVQLNTLAGELMWDAVLASVPEEPQFTPGPEVKLTPQDLSRIAGRYEFGPHAIMEFTAVGSTLTVRSSAPNFFDIPHDVPVQLAAESATEFHVAGRYQTRVMFIRGNGGKFTEALINPGRWAQHGRRLQH
jgi:hypothetical protein